MHTIEGIKNETFTIKRIDALEELNATRKTLLAHGKAPYHYYMERVTQGTRKKPYTVLALRFKSGRFTKLL